MNYEIEPIAHIYNNFKEKFGIPRQSGLAKNTLSKYDEEIMDDYDFGYFLKENVKEVETEDNEDKKTGFVVAGTKHPDLDTISWTK